MPHYYFTHPDWVLGPETSDTFDYWDYRGCLDSRDMRTFAQKAQKGGLQAGWGFAFFPTPVFRTGAIALGDNLDAPLSPTIKARIAMNMGLSRPLAASSVSVAEVLFEMFTLHGDPSGLTSWKPLLKPDRNGLLSLSLEGHGVIKSKTITQGDPEWAPILTGIQNDWVAMRREVEATERLLLDEGLTYRQFQANYAALRAERRRNPAIISTPLYRRLRAINTGLPPGFHARMLTTYAREYGIDGREFIPPGETDVEPEARGTSFSESWTTANSDNPDGDLDWTEVGGSDFDVLDNGIKVATGSSLRCEPAVGSENHFSEALVEVQGGSASAGVAVRFSASAEDFNAYLVKNSTSDTHRIFVITGGTSTKQGGSVNATPPSVPYTIKFKISSGGSGEGFIDDVSKISRTNDDHTGNVRGGLWCVAGIELDDFLLDDEAAGGDQTVTPATISTTMEVIAPTVAGSGSATLTPTVISTAMEVIAPTVAGSGSATLTPATISATMEVIAPTVVGSGSATITPATISTTMEVIAPTVAGSGSATLTPAVIATTMAVIAPTIKQTFFITPAVISTSMEVIAPTVAGSGSATLTPTVIAVTMAVISPSVSLAALTISATVISLAMVVIAVTARQVYASPAELDAAERRLTALEGETHFEL